MSNKNATEAIEGEYTVNAPASKPLPSLVRYVCKTCGNDTIQVEGSTILCQDCVNTFLARNVGVMEPENPNSGVVSEGTG